MESAVEKLQHVSLTKYEAKAYLALLNAHLSTATRASEKSGVPRTKIYSVLESLCSKGWVRVYSGVPLLFRAVDPASVFEKVKEDYAAFLGSVQLTLKNQVNGMANASNAFWRLSRAADITPKNGKALFSRHLTLGVLKNNLRKNCAVPVTYFYMHRTPLTI